MGEGIEQVVTPEIAMEWLTQPGPQRNVGRQTVKRYADLMRQRQWKLTPDAIAFNRQGQLVNGQHRLHAVVESGLPQHFYVIRDMEDDVVEALDLGRRRTTGDVLMISGANGDRQLAAALRVHILLRWSWSGKIKSWRDPAKQPTIQDILEENRQVDLSWAMGVARPAERSIRIPVSIFAPLLHTFNQTKADDARRFAEMVATGEDLKSGHPVYRLRAYQQQLKFRQAKQDRQMLAALLIKTWNFWRAGHRNVQLLKWSDVEAFPLPDQLGRYAKEHLQKNDTPTDDAQT